MKEMLFLLILILNSSFEKNIAVDSFLENIDSKEYSLNAQKQLKVADYLGNGDSKEYSSNGYCVYLDVLEFDKKITEINVTVTVHKGIVLEDVMYYLGSDEEKVNGAMVEFDKSKRYDKEDEGSYSHEKLYSKYTYIFKIPKLSSKYIYISIPYTTLTSDGYVEISVNKKFPGWAIALIVIGSVAVIAAIIIIIRCYKDYCCDCCDRCYLC